MPKNSPTLTETPIPRTAAHMGTSAGSDEAIHLIDSIIEAGPLTRKYPQYFKFNEKEKTYRFTDEAKKSVPKEGGELAELWIRSKRYGGKGCLNAVDNVTQVVAPRFLGQKISSLGSLADIDRELLALGRGRVRDDHVADLDAGFGRRSVFDDIGHQSPLVLFQDFIRDPGQGPVHHLGILNGFLFCHLAPPF